MRYPSSLPPLPPMKLPRTLPGHANTEEERAAGTYQTRKDGGHRLRFDSRDGHPAKGREERRPGRNPGIDETIPPWMSGVSIRQVDPRP